jgi:hypothetical protein
MKRLLDLRKEKTVECCNIARAAMLSNKIAAVGEKKFPTIVKWQSHLLSGKNKSKPVRCYDTVTYRVVVRPFGQGFTGLVIKTIDPRSVVGKIINATRWEVDPSIRYAGENDIIWDIEIDDKIERISLFSKPTAKSELRN